MTAASTPISLPLKRVAQINRRTLGEDTPADRPMRYVDISNVNENGQILLPQELVFEKAPSRARRLVTRGDTIISTVRTYLKAIAFLPEPDAETVVSTGFAVLTPKPEMDPRYLAWAVRSDSFVGEVVARSVGVSYPAIAPTELGDIELPVHPRPIQSKIADFLDRETAKIDALIEEKERLLKLLDERRQALITEAVTRGLDPNVPMKLSGLPWLGNIPAHWAMKRLKHVLASTATGFTPSTAEERYFGEAGLPWYTPASFTDQLILSEPVRHLTDLAIQDGQVRNFPAMSSLVIGIGATLGRVRFLDHTATGNQQLICLTFTGRVNAFYGCYFLRSHESVIRSMATGTTLPIIVAPDLVELTMPVPPLAEQETICDYVNLIGTTTKAASGDILTAIAALRSRRSALIHEAVTGQLQLERHT